MRTSTTFRAITLLAALAGFGLASPPATATVGYATISTGGPLQHVYAGVELSCQAQHELDAVLEAYPAGTVPGDCGTLLALDGVLYAPNFANHGSTATGSLGSYTPFAPVSQSGVSGTGTSSDPLVVTTTVRAATTGVQVTQRDAYVVGTTYVRSDITVTNSTDGDLYPSLYRALDCYLGASDNGYGFVTAGTGPAVGCSVNPDNAPDGRIEELVPLSPGNHYLEDTYSAVWAAIGSGGLADRCTCRTSLDNGAAIGWYLTVPAHGSVTRSALLDFRHARRPTQLRVPPALLAVRTAPIGETTYALTAQATLTDVTTGQPVPGKPVSFTAGSGTCAATTGSTGTASCTWLVTDDVWVVYATGYGASFGGDDTYLPSNDWAHLASVDGLNLP